MRNREISCIRIGFPTHVYCEDVAICPKNPEADETVLETVSMTDPSETLTTYLDLHSINVVLATLPLSEKVADVKAKPNRAQAPVSVGSEIAAEGGQVMMVEDR
ncbi:hypothetical protein PGT21_015658 [Puccinia graminis f. sp. tritici]|uniref:Uncharacterized protein n=1 Tax=Puccinia graminis f. sp. tritici TaxID=56615 RepID=A0A5B0PXN0_PUCGR|nr:hypothetical protein PGTUg99_012840 [Puccinia graminis f. sp. tritici]KAA1105688.1 hypothetical protein PGT21_015658 [Puccinia graminis f. sp. tritici]